MLAWVLVPVGGRETVTIASPGAGFNARLSVSACWGDTMPTEGGWGSLFQCSPER